MMRRTRIVLLAAASSLLPASAFAQEGPPPALVVSARVSLEALTESVEIVGTVWPRLDSLVASETDGRVAARLVESGDRVTKGQELLRIDPLRLQRELEVALASKAETEARLQLAIRQERRAHELHDKEVLSPGLLDEAISERQAQEGRLDQISARVASIQEEIQRTEIRAPFEGIVTEIRTEVGEWLGRGDPVLRLADLETLEIRLDVPERYFPLLRKGAQAPATLDSLPGLKLEGSIFALVPQADPDAHTFPVRVRAANPRSQVGAGMLARVRLTLGRSTEALMVPKDAIVRQAQQVLVYVIDGDAVRAVPVRTGRANGTQIEVTGDVKVNDRVVVRGNERLAPGQKVREEIVPASKD